MLRKTAAGSVCDEHPGLGAMTDEKAWRHLTTAHPDHAKWASNVAEQIAAANAPRSLGRIVKPRRKRGKRRARRRR